MNTHAKTSQLVRLALLVAILILMAFTPLGYLKTAAFEITFLMLPVVVGAIVIGPGAGALLGAVFGLTSFIQCLGASPLGVVLMSINPFFTFVTCMVPRVLAGWLPGLIFRAMRGRKEPRLWAYITACLSGSILNTVLFFSALMLLFGNTEFIQSFGENVWTIVVALGVANAIIEIPANSILGTAVTKALRHFSTKRKTDRGQ